MDKVCNYGSVQLFIFLVILIASVFWTVTILGYVQDLELVLPWPFHCFVVVIYRVEKFEFIGVVIFILWSPE